MFSGELYAQIKITEVNLFAFVYRLFHEDFSPIVGTNIYVWFKYNLGQKYHAPQVQPRRGLNSWPPDHDSTFNVTETPAITTRHQ